MALKDIALKNKKPVSKAKGLETPPADNVTGLNSVIVRNEFYRDG